MSAVMTCEVHVSDVPFALTHEVASDRVLVSTFADGAMKATYATPDADTCPWRWEWDEDEFSEFSTQWDRDDYIAELAGEYGIDEDRIFVVTHYEHSAHHYSVAGTVGYADARWDTRPSGVYVVPEDVPVDRRIEYANARLDAYSNHVNGWYYGVITDAATPLTDGGFEVEDDAVWGFVGLADAEAGVRDYHPTP